MRFPVSPGHRWCDWLLHECIHLHRQGEKSNISNQAVDFPTYYYLNICNNSNEIIRILTSTTPFGLLFYVLEACKEREGL